MSPDESDSELDTTAEEGRTENDSPGPGAKRIEPQQTDRRLPLNQQTANQVLPNEPPNRPQKPTAAPKPVSPARPVPPEKPTAEKLITPPAEPHPSLPVSMILRPDRSCAKSNSPPADGELEESFESALTRVERTQSRGSAAGRIVRRICALIGFGAQRGGKSIDVRRTVPFDGFQSDLFDNKRERDRRYGTVYTVSEELNAFLVRLELPRRMPISSLKQTWELPDEIPDYACQVSVIDGVLIIRAGLPDEARRRLSYVSSSFPSDFQTRIEFPVPVGSYKHRICNHILEVIVFKKPSVNPGRSGQQDLH
jgi:hypothetical protein